jgi:hypothetical protein
MEIEVWENLKWQKYCFFLTCCNNDDDDDDDDDVNLFPNTERHARVVSIPASNSVDPRFISHAGDWLPWLRVFAVFLNPPRQMARQYLKLGHDGFLPNPVHFVSH